MLRVNKILFFYSSLKIGGIETFFTRLAKESKNLNTHLSFIFYTKNIDEELIIELNKYSKVTYLVDFCKINNFYFNKIPPFIKPIFFYNNKKLKKYLSSFNHIHIPDLNSLIIFSGLCILLKIKSIKISLGIYHNQEYIFNKNRIYQKILFRYLNNIPEINWIFFNEAIRENYKNYFSKTFKRNSVIPIGYFFNNDLVHGNINGPIITISRFTKWKTYLYSILFVIKELKDEGIYRKCIFFGEGEIKKDLENLINDLKLNDLIQLNGNIKQQEFNNKIKGCSIFIGTGTSILEAAANGIPCLIGIENEPKENCFTYGLIGNIKGFAYQEQGLNLKKLNLKDEILNILNTNDYQELAKKSISYSSKFKIQNSLNGFLKKTNQIQEINIIPITEYLTLVFQFYLFASLGLEKNFRKRLTKLN